MILQLGESKIEIPQELIDGVIINANNRGQYPIDGKVLLDSGIGRPNGQTVKVEKEDITQEQYILNWIGQVIHNVASQYIKPGSGRIELFKRPSFDEKELAVIKEGVAQEFAQVEAERLAAIETLKLETEKK